MLPLNLFFSPTSAISWNDNAQSPANGRTSLTAGFATRNLSPSKTAMACLVYPLSDFTEVPKLFHSTISYSLGAKLS